MIRLESCAHFQKSALEQMAGNIGDIIPQAKPVECEACGACALVLLREAIAYVLGAEIGCQENRNALNPKPPRAIAELPPYAIPTMAELSHYGF